MRRVLRGVLPLAGMMLFTMVSARTEGQSFTQAVKPDPRITARETTEIVDALAHLMAASYVDSARGVAVRKKLLAKKKAGGYRAFTAPRPLVSQLIADVQSVIADDHFNILYFPPEAEGFKWVNSGEGARDEKAQLEEARARLRGTNFGVAKAEVLENNIGWLTIAKFDAPLELLREPLAAAFELLRNTDALIIDLRKNPGGNPECVQLAFSYFIEGPDRLATTEYHRGRGERKEYRTYADPGGAHYLGRPVFVLTGPATGSGAEMFCYQMKNYRRGTMVGLRTSGAAHSFDTYKIGSPEIGNVMVLVPDARMVDALTRGDWERTGVEPDIEAGYDDAPGLAIRAALDSLMARAKGEGERARYQSQIEKMAFLASQGVLQVRDLEKYVGRYGIRRVFVEDGRLKYQRDNGPPVDLEPVAENTFELNVAMTPKPRVRFEVEGGEATVMVLNTSSGEERIERER